MSLPGPSGSGAPDDPDDPERSPGAAMEPTSLGFLAGWLLAGLVLGRALRPVAERLLGTAPVITWTQPLALLAVAAVLGATARATHRVVQVHRIPLPPHRAVNRLLVARASALVAALTIGGYAGYALAWLGSDAVLAEQRIVRSLLCCLAGAGIAAAALLLERACRARSPDPEP